MCNLGPNGGTFSEEQQLIATLKRNGSKPVETKSLPMPHNKGNGAEGVETTMVVPQIIQKSS